MCPKITCTTTSSKYTQSTPPNCVKVHDTNLLMSLDNFSVNFLITVYQITSNTKQGLELMMMMMMMVMIKTKEQWKKAHYSHEFISHNYFCIFTNSTFSVRDATGEGVRILFLVFVGPKPSCPCSLSPQHFSYKVNNNKSGWETQ